ncbi:MAG: GNAT family N-acetyltransferase [Armatimonadetes bacterium]|nr:GNAT family N-acetyltransferase [Armatimonadota bacterium]NIO76531.1 GNAT family N-acetyltransferase [Armatimonadota bacterium]NIO96190.1 GNAT family N-acetyltransferase [Armatimonadota bacterium]
MRQRSDEVNVRPAAAGDAERIAALSEQLGYAATAEEMQRRLNSIEEDKTHAVYVAEVSGENVVGWVHIYSSYLLVRGSQAEIGGLIVDASHRRSGIGQLLIQHAEEWARAKGCNSINIRSNITRREAHAFYKKIGYKNVKTQRVFRKIL